MIQEAATKLFAQRGYTATSVEDIATAAGVTKPMLYRHFESKRDLCIRLLEVYRDDLITAALQNLEGTRPSTEPGGDSSRTGMERRLTGMIDAWLAWVESHPDPTRLLFTPIRGDVAVRGLQEDLFRRQRDTQAALLREFVPGIPDADAEPLAEMTRAAFAALALWWLDHPERPRAAARRALATLALGVVSAADRPSDD
ncbi:MAG TPA: helix-turn-helix domain-containing protein [Solirubrobacterales bacterium]